MTYSSIYSPYTLGHPRFFKLIESERPAYWLGFLAADGYVRKNRLYLALSGKDKWLIEQFRDDVQATNPIYDQEVKGHPVAKLCISCPQLIKDLESWGVTQRKTYSLEWPNIPPAMISHFIRGYVDGDGGFYATYNKYTPLRPNIQFRVSSTMRFLKPLQKHLMIMCNLKNKTKIYQDKRRPNTSGTLIYCGRQQVKRIFNYLYQDATIWLHRKRAKIEPHLSEKFSQAARDFSMRRQLLALKIT